MRMRSPRRSFRWHSLGALALMLAGGRVAPALTPKSPEVKALVASAIPVLERDGDTRTGAKALFGLALLKADIKPDHPVIQKALAEVREAHKSQVNLKAMDVYTVGLCTIFLIEADPKGNSADIQAYLDHLLSLQKPHGGWGYHDRTTGDTSMTQYGVLAMWEASQAGFKTPLENWERVANWLLRTQDPNGAWGYQGNDPGSMALVAQNPIRPSMASAGLGSLYICADHFRVRVGGPTGTPGVPSALQQVRKGPEAPAIQPLKTSVDLTVLTQALARGDAWMEANYTINPIEYPHYFLYAFERYQSFRELITNRPFGHSHWYDDGVVSLTKTQENTGGWSGATGRGTDTAFSILFLMRSSRKSIERAHHLGPGTLVSGRGLPVGNDVELRQGQVRPKPLAGPAEQLLAAIEDPGHPDYLRAMEGLEDKVTSSTPADLNRLSDRLRRLAGGDDPAARAAALRALARTRDLNNVPMILTALVDKDDDVFLAAEEALGFMSRTIPEPTDNDGVTPARRAGAIRKWRAWFLSIRPNARLDD